MTLYFTCHYIIAALLLQLIDNILESKYSGKIEDMITIMLCTLHKAALKPQNIITKKDMKIANLERNIEFDACIVYIVTYFSILSNRFPNLLKSALLGC